MAYFTKYFCSYRLDKKHVLILNTLTNAIDVVDNETFKNIKNIKDTKSSVIEPKLLKFLEKRGYVFKRKTDEENLLRKFQSIREKIMHEAVNVNYWTICTSMECNLRRTYCYENHTQHSNPAKISNLQLKTIFNYITHSKNSNKNNFSKNCYIAIYGGEPLLKTNYGIVKEILKFSQRIDYPLHITTNGTTVDSDYLNLLSQYRDILHMQITLDGDKFIHDQKRIYCNGRGTFDVICKTIDKILNSKIQLNVRINVDKANIQNLGSLKKCFDTRGWSKNPLFHVYAAPIRYYQKNGPEISDSKMLDILIRNNWYNDSFIKRLDSSVFDSLFNFFDDNVPNSSVKLWNISYCAASYGSHYCFVPNGIITTCIRAAGNKRYMIGSFDENNVTIDKDKLSEWKNRSPFEIEKCKDCKFILLCGGGCAKCAITTHGNINCGICNDIEKTLEIYVKHNKNRFLSQSILHK